MPSRRLPPREPDSSAARVDPPRDDWTRQSEEVFYARGLMVAVHAADVERLKDEAHGNSRQRARLCAHSGIDDPLHEMFVVHSAGTYVRPHRHRGKSESFHVVDGLMDVLVFDDSGQIVTSLRMGAYGSGHTFYCRLNESAYHSLVFRTPLVVFQEITPGPFDRSRTEFAPWAPAEDEATAPAYFSWLQTRTDLDN